MLFHLAILRWGDSISVDGVAKELYRKLASEWWFTISGLPWGAGSKTKDNCMGAAMSEMSLNLRICLHLLVSSDNV